MMMFGPTPPLPNPPPGVWANASLTNRFMLASKLPTAKGGALCHRRPQPPGLCQYPLRQAREAAFGDRRPDLAHQVEIEMHVMQCRQAHPQDLIAAVQVPQVGARIALAGRTAAGGVDRSGIALVHRIADVDDARGGKQ